MGGIGRYSLELAKAMTKLCRDDEIFILLNDQNKEGEAYVRRAFIDLLPPNAIKVCSIPRGSAFLSDLGKTARIAEAIREHFISQIAPDAVHVSSMIEGLGEDIVTSCSNGEKIVTAVTLYDLIPFRQPDVYLSDKNVRTHYHSKVSQLQKADVLLGISKFSADEGIEYLTDFSGEVVDIRGGVDPTFRPMKNARSAIEGLCKSLGVGEKFFLYTASFDQRKNQKGLIEAFSKLPASIRASRQLVIVGKGWPAAYDELHAFALGLGVPSDKIIFTGRVSDEELHALYSCCELFVFPSFWEGLGMPVLEAMACGAAVLASNTTSVLEVLGWEEASFDPFDSASIAGKIMQALNDPNFMEALKEHGRRHCKGFTWEESARRALTSIRNAIVKKQSQNISTTSNSIDDVVTALRGIESDHELVKRAALCLASNQIELGQHKPSTVQCKIGWVTSWGNRCGIANYSADLLEHFEREVVVFGHIDEHLPQKPGVIRSWHQGKEHSLDVLAQNVESENITDIVIQFNYGFFNFEALNWFISTQIMQLRRVYIALHSTQDPLDEYGHRIKDLKDALIQCNRIFVHNDADVERLREIGIVGNVSRVSLGLKNFGEPTIRNQKRTKKKKYCVAAYGFFLPRKGLPELVEATAILRRDGHDVSLLLVNADYGDSGGVSRSLIEETHSLSESIGVKDFISFETDFLPDDRSVTLLRTADLIVYPYQSTGESASAAVRMGLASGVPLAVTPLPIFDDVREAAFTLPGISPKDIANGIVLSLEAIESKSPEALTKQSAANSLRYTQGYSSIAPYIEGLIEKEAMRERWLEYFIANPSAMLLLGGTLKNGVVTSNPNGGVISYGPFITLDAGLHRIVVRGSTLPSADGDCGTLAIKTVASDKTLATFPINAQPGSDGVILDRKFRVPERMADLEFIFSSFSGATLEIAEYRLSQRQT